MTPDGSAAARAGRGAAEALAALTATVCFLHRAAFSSDILVRRDVMRVYYPLRHYLAERLRGGHLPEWYPFDALGQPFIGMGLSAVFHPTTALFLFLPLGAALKWSLLLANAGALFACVKLLARFELGGGAAVVGGVAYAFNGYALSMMGQNPLYGIGLATLPWVLWAADGFAERGTAPRALVTGLAAATILFVGDAQMFVWAVLCAGGLILVRSPGTLGRRALKAALLMGLALGLSAVQLVPSLAISQDAAGMRNSIDTALQASAHPLRLLELGLGPLFVDASREQVGASWGRALEPGLTEAWADSTHVGATVLFLAGLGVVASWRSPRGRLLLSALVLVGVLWLGRYLGLSALLAGLPGAKFLRYPEKLTPLLALGLCAFAARGMKRLEERPEQRRRLGAVAVGAGVLVLVLGALEWRLQLVSRGVMGTALGPVAAAAALDAHQNVLHGAVQSAVALVVTGSVMGGVAMPALRGALVALAVMGNLFVADEPLVSLAPSAVLAEKPELVSAIERDSGGSTLGMARYVSSIEGAGRLASADDTLASAFSAWVIATGLIPDFPAIFGLETASLYLPAGEARINEAALAPWESGLFNTKYLVMNEGQRQRAGVGEALIASRIQELGLDLVRVPHALPRAYLASPICAPESAPPGELLRTPGLPWGRAALVSCVGPRPPSTFDVPGSAGEVKVTRYEPELVELDVSAARDEIVVLNDAFYSGWRATVDGLPARIHRANALVRAVRVQAGKHRVRFEFRTPGLLVGGLISSAALLLALMAAVVQARRT